MNRFAPSFLVLLAALAFWIPGRWDLLKARHALSDSKTRLADLQSRLAADQSALASARRERQTKNRARFEAADAVDNAQHELAKIDPESQWANPPASLADWNPASPYFWVPKEFLPQLGLDVVIKTNLDIHSNVFAPNGGLTSEMASILAIDEQTRRTVNGQLERALADFHSLQIANARQSDDSLGRTADGPVVTVKVEAMPEEGERLCEQITQILHQNLGAQRTSMVTNMGQWWFTQSDISGQHPFTITVMRHPDGKYMVDSFSSGFFDRIPASDAPQYIPEYLLPFFADILNPPAIGQ